MNPRNFFAELKRRNVYKVAVAYAIVGWLLVQVATQVFPFFEIPNWAIRLVVLLIVIGFPIALVVAWAFELTPEGLKRTEDADAMPVTSAGPKKRAWIYIVVIGAVISVALFFVGRYTGQNKTAAPNDISNKSIAVLPFDSLSEDKNNAFFAEGIQDEILTRLAKVADLKVISRTSTQHFKSAPENLPEIAKQLGVANILEGSVQKENDQVRVNVQLIDARADNHLWAKSYDREVKDVFAVESEISQEVADALQAKLSPNETHTLSTAPTSDAEAYDLFLKGEYEAREALATRKPEAFDKATRFYQQAIARDPGFALAIARMVENQMLRHWFITRLGEADLGEIKRNAEHAVALAPNLPQAHIALGVCYYYGYRHYDQALSEFQRAIELQANNVQALEYCGYVHLRQGRMQEGLSELEKSEQLDPRDDSLLANIGSASLGLRMWKEASRAGLHALALNPNNVFAMNSVLFSPINAGGDINEATRILGTFPSDAVLGTNGYQIDGIIGGRAYLDVIKREFGAALRVREKETSDPTATRQRLPVRAAIHVLAGDAISAQDEVESGRTLIEARLREKPDDQNALIELAWIDLAQNRDSDALSLAQKSADLLPPEKDAYGGPSAPHRPCPSASARRRDGRSGEKSAAPAVVARRLLYFHRATEDRSNVGPDPE